MDGIILEGRSSLDESLVTGESMPVTKEDGGKVIAGTLNQSGGFVMRAEKVGRDTLLSQIVKMVAEAQRSRAPIQRLADQVSGWFVPVVIVAALIAFGAWAWFGPEPRMAFGLVAAVSVLIIACPCALGLATPMSIMVGVGRGAQAGVLIKNAEALERMEKIDTLVVDKTGTLTEGKPKVVAIVLRHRATRHRILDWAGRAVRVHLRPLFASLRRYPASLLGCWIWFRAPVDLHLRVGRCNGERDALSGSLGRQLIRGRIGRWTVNTWARPWLAPWALARRKRGLNTGGWSACRPSPWYR